MARFIISQKKKGKLNLSIPHYILINGKMLGLMRDPAITIEVPPATFEVRIQSMFKWFYSSAVVTTHEGTDTFVDFTDREMWWMHCSSWTSFSGASRGCFILLLPGHGYTRYLQTVTLLHGSSTSGRFGSVTSSWMAWEAQYLYQIEKLGYENFLIAMM